jgi:hypothetical protein
MDMFKPEISETMKIFEDLYHLNPAIVAGLRLLGRSMASGPPNPPDRSQVLRPYPSDSVCHERDTIEIALQLAALAYLADLRTRFMAYHTAGNHFS